MTRFLLIAVLLIPSAPVSANWFSDIKNIIFNSSEDNAHTEITDNNIAAALKQALMNGADSVVDQLSAGGGFNDDLNIRIELPAELQAVQKTLHKVGLGGSLDALEDKLNAAAEVATIKAKPLFVDAIQTLSWTDVRAILNGPDNAATAYFQSKMAAPLSAEMQPVVAESLHHVGAVRTYNSLMDSYNALPFIPQVEADLSAHVTNKSIAGIFHYLALEEKSIRHDPTKHTSELLKKVFSP